MIRKWTLIAILLSSAFLFGCSNYQKLLKSDDYEKKYEKGVELYKKGDYYRALQLFDQVIPVYRGKEKAKDLFYYYAQSYYKQEDYVMASYYFKRYAKNFPRTDRAEEAWYMAAYCKYLQSPRYSLDQSKTKEAIEQLQSFANRYPQSDRIDRVNGLIDDLRGKLEKKIYEKSELYFNMELYEAAVVSYKNLLKKYPDTKFREKVLFKIVKARYIYASNSVASKQMERYQKTIEAYDKLMNYFPDTQYMDEAKEMYSEASNFMADSN